MVHLNFFYWFAFSLCLLESQVNVQSMLLLDFLMQLGYKLFTQFIGAQSHTEVISGDAEHIGEWFFYVIVNVIHAQIKVLELWVLDRHPNLHCFSLVILLGDLLDIVQCWHRLFWLFACLQFLIFLNNCISALE